VKNKTKIPSGDFPKLAEKLTVLESVLGEEYCMFVQLKTLELMMKEINQSTVSIWVVSRRFF
jgi:hypothetical protein